MIQLHPHKESASNMLVEAPVLERFTGDLRRIVSPEVTFGRVIKMAPAMGITRVANITGLDTTGIPVYTAYRPNARSLSVMQGKGYTHAAAKTSALMEAVETYHAETIDLPLKLNSYAALSQRHDVLDVTKLPRSKDNPFTPDSRILWIEAEDLYSGRKKYAPYEMVHLDYREQLPSGHGCFVPSSNGLASGNHPLEAIVHGICEVIETDALAMWRLGPASAQNASKIDLNTITDPRCLDLLNMYKRANIHVALWEITGANGIPAILCRILPDLASDISGIRPASGMGCHLLKEVATLRALTEAAQSRVTFISGARDDVARESYNKFLSLEEYSKWFDHISEKRPATRNFQSIPSYHTDSLKEDLDLLLRKLQQNGINEVGVVHLTKPEFNIPVVRVIIPGLSAGTKP